MGAFPFNRALVTGGAGFIGSQVAERLLQLGAQVRVLDDLSVGLRENVPAGAEMFVGDVRDADAVDRALDGVDLVFHLAARVSIRASVERFYDDAQTNVMGTLRLLQGCAAHKVSRFVYASSMGVYADAPTPAPIPETHPTEPISPYGVGKLAGEKYLLCLASVLNVEPVILRYFNTYGPRQGYTPYVGVITIFIKRLMAGEPPIIFGDGEQSRDFVYVGDLADATVLAAQKAVASEVFNIGTGIATSVNRVAEMLCRKLNPAIRPVHAPEHPGELRFSVPDIGKAKRLLGYDPKGRLEERIDEIIAWHRR
jgi:UDP-glucose 4-epimerase